MLLLLRVACSLLGLLVLAHVECIGAVQISNSLSPAHSSILGTLSSESSHHDVMKHLANKTEPDYFGSDIADLVPPSSIEVVMLVLLLAISLVCMAIFSQWFGLRKEEMLEKEVPTIPAANAIPWMHRLIIGLSLIVLIVSTYFIFTWYVVGHVMRSCIEHYDVSFLGVEVHLDNLKLNPFNGDVTASGLAISNPPGWKTANLLSVGSVLVDIDLLGLVFSWGSSIGVDRLFVDDVEVTYEKSLTTSNVNDMIAILKSKYGTVSGTDGIQVLMHEVSIAGPTVVAALSGVLAVPLHLPDIYFNDFAEEVKNVTSVQDMTEFLFNALLSEVPSSP